MTTLRPRRTRYRRQVHWHALEPLEPRLALAVSPGFVLDSPIVSEFVSSYYDVDFPGDRADPEGSARTFLAAVSAALGMKSDTSDLRLIEVKQGIASSHTRLEQTLDGRPIDGAYVSVHQGSDGSIQTLHTQYYSQISAVDRSSTIGFADATDAAVSAAQVSQLGSPPEGELVWYPEDTATVIPAWRITVPAVDPIGDFLTLVDARTGEIISQDNLVRFLTGTGMVFHPNPVQTLGAAAAVADNFDADSPALDAQRIPVALKGLEPLSGLLKGEFVDVASLDSPDLPYPDANEPTRVYDYTRDDPRFEQVVVYHHVDSMQRYLHALGYDDDVGVVNGIRDFPTRANVHWWPFCCGFYRYTDDAIFFGDSDVDVAEDGDIIAHEYAHAIQIDQNASFVFGGDEMRAMGEGFADYWAASFFADRGDPDYQSAHAACVGEWDSHGDDSDDPPCLRRVDGDKIYPDDLIGQEHADGEIWSRALWDIRRSLGGQAADQLILEHHFGLPPSASMPVAARAMLDADANLNGAKNTALIRTAFALRNILPPESTPTSAAVAVDIHTGGDSEHTVTATYVDDTAINIAQLGNSDIRVSGPDGFEQFARLSKLLPSQTGSPRLAEYRIEAPGGTWDEADNGEYTISILGNEVSDINGNFVEAARIGTFRVNIREAPSAAAIAADITIEGATAQAITVEYADGEAIDVSDLGDGDIRVTGPNGFDQSATLLSVNNDADGRQRFARYSITAPDGSWTAFDNGQYTVHVVEEQVHDIRGNEVTAAPIGVFEVSIIDIPMAVATAPMVTANGGAGNTVTVTYFDNDAVDATEIGDGDIRVTGANEFVQLGRLVSLYDDTDGSPRVAEYTITAPGGHWDPTDNGTYEVHVVADEVLDADGNTVLAGKIGEFEVEVSAVDGYGYEAHAVAPVFERINDSNRRVLFNANDQAVELTDAALGDFEFEFYGHTYTNLFVSSNGIITFGEPAAEADNSDLSAFPNQPAIAALWDDLLVADRVYWAVSGLGTRQRLIVQWEAEYVTGDNRISFQAILSENDGSIQFNYRDLNGNSGTQDEGRSATVGIKDEGTQGSNRLLLTHNSSATSFVGSNRSTRIHRGSDVTLRFDASTVDESGGEVAIIATVSQAARRPITIDLDFFGGARENHDFTASAQQLVIPAGSTTGSVALMTIPDEMHEDDERVIVVADNATNGAVPPGLRLTTTIIDDDEPPTVSLMVDQTPIVELNGEATFTAVLSKRTNRLVVVDLAFSGTAALHDDYTISGTQIVIFETTGSVTVTAIQDSLDEPGETVLVDIARVTNANTADPQQQTTTIVDGDSLQVASLDITTSGVVAAFNKAVDLADLNLYGIQSTGIDPADAALVGSAVGPVAGSLFVDSADDRVTFVKSGGPLLPDTYTFTLRSAADAFKDATGDLLDGNGDGLGGDDYVTVFTVESPAADAVTIGIPDFVRGPGQTVNLPADSTTGIPLVIGPSANVRTADVRIRYNPALLDITGATAGADAPVNAAVVLQDLGPGLANVVFFSPTPLPVAGGTFVNLVATIPSNDPDIYRGQHVVDLHSAIVSDGSGTDYPVIEDDAVHLATYFADVSGNGRINAADAAQVASVVALIDSGFVGSTSFDPVIMGDITGNGRINAADASRVAQFIALLEVPEIPSIPGGVAVAGAGLIDLGPGLPGVLPLRVDTKPNDAEPNEPNWLIPTVGSLPAAGSDVALAAESDLEHVDLALEAVIEDLLSAGLLGGE